MVKIGIGIPTYNRLPSLQQVIKDIKKFVQIPYDLFVAIDGSTDGTINWIKDICSYTVQPRQGVCSVKNAILKHFRNYDYIFIIEDDMRILKPGIIELYLKAIIDFKIQHFNFLHPSQIHPTKKPPCTIENITIAYSSMLGGGFSTYTKEIINKVGGFNPKFKGYGHGHCEYTLRISRVGLTSEWGHFAYIVNANKYLYHGEIPNTSTNEEVIRQRTSNHEILKESLKNKHIIYIPL